MGRGKRKNIVVEMWVYLNENLGISHTLILSNSFVCFVCSFVSLFVLLPLIGDSVAPSLLLYYSYISSIFLPHYLHGFNSALGVKHCPHALKRDCLCSQKVYSHISIWLPLW